MYKWSNPQKTAFMAEVSPNHFVVVEDGHPLWSSVDHSTIEDAYEEPPPDPRDKMRLSFAQLLIGLVAESWITEAEGEAWLGGTLPVAVVALIATLPSDQQFPAKARATVPSVVRRLDPLVEQLAAAQGKTPEELDQFFITYAQV